MLVDMAGIFCKVEFPDFHVAKTGKLQIKNDNVYSNVLCKCAYLMEYSRGQLSTILE